MIKELGDYKNRLHSIFVNDDEICRLLLGEDYENADYDLDNELDKYIIPHLYVNETITETKSYILYETNLLNVGSSIKEMGVIIQVVCHKNIVKYPEKPQNYPGLRYDVLAEYIEELLCPTSSQDKERVIKKFGIGSFEMRPPELFLTDKYIGRILTFTTPDFR